MSKISDLIFAGKKHYITSPYGKRNVISTSSGTTSSFHSGTDYGTYSKKLPQYAIEDGTVLSCGTASDGAKYVWVGYPRIGKKLLHYHLDSIAVKKGQAVKKGTLLGKTGKTGKATGIHLHLGIRDLAKLTSTQINKMTWNLLRSCAYIDPEKVSYTAPTSAAAKPAVTYLPRYTGKSNSLVDALKAVKVDSSFSYRKKIANKNGIKAYIGTASQNTKLLTLLKAGKAVKP